MNIIQSYWSYPMLSKYPDYLNRTTGGWLDVRFNLMSWALSCLTLSRMYPNISLFTDDDGKKLLIDFLELPYCNVQISLNILKTAHPNPNLWALGKIHTYQQQNEPFLHVDGDIYLWKPFNIDLWNAPILCQNKEIDYPFYERTIKNVLDHFDYIPDEIFIDRQHNSSIIALNAGILGGNDVEFFKTYSKTALSFVQKNIAHQDKVDLVNFNMIYEQYLCYCMAEVQKKKVACLFPKISHHHSELLQFHQLPHLSSYIHVIGYAKRNPFACEQVEARLAYEFPDYYSDLMEKINFKFKDSVPVSSSKERQAWLFNGFRFLERKTREDLLNTKFICHSNVEFVSEDEVVYKHPHSRNLIKEHQSQHNAFYQFFQTPLSIYELYDELVKANHEIVHQHTKPELLDKFLNLALQNFLYDEYLMVYEIGK